MKKIITIILVCMLFIPVLANGEELLQKKLGDLTFEELSIINYNIQLRMFEKGSLIDGVKVPAGLYVVGTDIPSGTYRIEYRPSDEYDFCSFLATNEAEMFGYQTMLGFGGASEIGKIELTDGTNIQITRGDVYFYTYTGLFH